jgi:hypothetical protein
MKGVHPVVAKAKEKKEEDLLTVDDAFLKRYVDLQGARAKVEDVTTGEQVDLADLSDVVEQQEDTAKSDKELNAALQRGKAQARKEQALHRRAQKMDAASAEREAKEQEREAALQRKEAEREEDEKRARSIRDVRHVTRGINQALQQNVQPAIERAGTLPTVGGIGLMVGILLLLLIVIIPVNAQGDTRAKQFWYMLNGRAKLQGAVSPVVGSQVAGASGNFGPGTSGTPNTIIPNTTAAQNGSFRTTPSNLGF